MGERKAQKKAQKESKKRRRADEEEAQEAPTDFNAEPSAPPKMQRVESDCLLRAPKEDEEYVLIRVPAEFDCAQLQNHSEISQNRWREHVGGKWSQIFCDNGRPNNG